MQVAIVSTPGLGNRSYVVSEGDVTVVVDPQRDLDRIAERVPPGTTITHVLETHLHNDYVSGGLELARREGADYVLAADEDITFERLGVRDGDVIDTGGLRVTVLATPGHTPHHVAYVISDGERRALFTGGSLLYGAVGRTDLLGADATDRLSRLQHRSARRLADTLPADTPVYPTHGFGSFCASGDGAAQREDSTIGDERVSNLALTITSEDEFARTLLAGFDAYPRYYAHMAPINQAGPQPLDLSPPVDVDPDGLVDRQASGEWLVDIRDRLDFAACHLSGTVNIELADTLPIYLGWLLPWGTPVTILASDADEVARAQRMLARIGIDRPAGRGLDAPTAYLKTVEAGDYPVEDFAGLASARDDGGPVVLDVRRQSEWADGHIAGAAHVPLHELSGRMAEVPQGVVWVHCASGYRSAIAASLLAAAGRAPVLINDEFANAATAGLEVVVAT